jgi:hypothetical protein
MFLKQVVHCNWLQEGDELEVFPTLMECHPKRNAHDRLTAVGLSDGQISSGGLKTAFKRMVFT